MKSFKKHYPSIATTSISPLISPVVLLVLFTFGSRTVTVAQTPSFAKSENDSPQICGTIRTESGETVTLEEGITVSPEDFEKVHVKKLKGATISVPGKNCAIQLCGFTSWGEPNPEGYIGTTSDYSDCRVFKGQSKAPLPTYDDLFNASSVNCGCNKREPNCHYTCESRYAMLNKTWTENDCAVLFQESACKNCYFNPVNISNGQNYSTDHSHQIRSLVVRDHCRVKQYIPALKRMWTFKDISQPIIYNEGPATTNVKSAFQSDPEYFYCVCGEPPITTPSPLPSSSSSTTESLPVKPPVKLTYPSSIDSLTIGLIVGGVIIALIIGATSGISFAIWSNRIRNPIFFPTCFEKEKDNSSIQKHGSTSTQCTIVTVSDNDDDNMLKLGDSRIHDLPFDVAFDTSTEHFEVGTPIDAGNFGQVYNGSLQVAIKKVKVSGAAHEREISIRSLQQEIKILAHLGSHKNVVRLLGAHVGGYENNELCLIVELCKNGSLKSYLEFTVKPRINAKLREIVLGRMGENLGNDGYPQNPEGISLSIIEGESKENDLQNLDPEMNIQFYKWAHQIACGMQFIQSKQIIHVDLASRNVLLNHKLIAKIGDFGLSKRTYIKDYVSSRKDSLPLRWVAPEALKDSKCSTKSDVWSFGVTVWEIFNLGKDPYEGMDWAAVMATLWNPKGKRLDCPQFAPEDVYAKLQECWSEDPDERPSFDNLELYFDLKLKQLEPTSCGEVVLNDYSQQEQET